MLHLLRLGKIPQMVNLQPELRSLAFSGICLYIDFFVTMLPGAEPCPWHCWMSSTKLHMMRREQIRLLSSQRCLPSLPQHTLGIQAKSSRQVPRLAAVLL